MPRRKSSPNGRPEIKDDSPDGGPPYVVRRSRIHGRGVFAVRAIPKGTRIIEYTGRRISNALADELYGDREGTPGHTFLFELDDDVVIDAGQGGNAARWINHSCDPNCEAVEEDGRIFIDAIRTIAAGEELGYDYGIVVEAPPSASERRRWPCYCGAPGCRRTLLATDRPPAQTGIGSAA
jgi:SET domain-containing protein